jgi:hypothetical protein
MAATYFSLTGASANEILYTSSDDRNKKTAISINHRYKNQFTLDPLLEINNLFLVSSLELNSSKFTFNNMQYNKVHTANLGLALTKIGLFSDRLQIVNDYYVSLIIGVSDKATPVVANRFDFIAQQKICYPLTMRAKDDRIDLPLMDKKCAFSQNSLYINVFSELLCAQTGDIEPYIVYTTAVLGGGYFVDNIDYNLSVLIDGVME